MENSPLYIKGIRLKGAIPDEDYVGHLSVVENLAKMQELPFRKNVTFFVGENGIGKSTLIEAVAVAFGFNAEGGTRNFNFHTRSTHSDLWQYLTLVRGYLRPKDGFFLRAESFYNVSTNIDEMDEDPGGGASVISGFGGTSLHSMSHGESFLATVENRFGGNGLYILDEPEAALSPNGIMRLIASMHRLVKSGSQFIVSTHSPMLIAFPDSEVYEITADGISSVPYDKTQHYTTTRRFLENPKKMLGYLLEGDADEK